MKISFRYLLTAIFLVLGISLFAQNTQWREMHKVKKHETIFGIANEYGISIEELINCNPDMKQPGYQLKKGDYIFIPYAKGQHADNRVKSKTPTTSEKDITKRAIKIGIMLPLHNINGDGKRMTEYYRGILLACEQLKKSGISTDVRAWNIPEDADIRQTLLKENARTCDVIYGPLYSNMVNPLAEFCKTYDIKLVIPFSITATDASYNPAVFQIYQSQEDIHKQAINAFLNRFADRHVVFIDCNDKESDKGIFTFGLRQKLEAAGIDYSITNLKSSEAMFAKAFNKNKANVVVLNTGRSPELNVAFAKIANLIGYRVSLFGYTEWLMYEKYDAEDFFKYDTYIPTTFYYNPTSASTSSLEQIYRRSFGNEMMQSLPRFAITGYDHAMFFLTGLHKYGKKFTGDRRESTYQPLQSPLHFVHIGNGGYKNKSFQLIHYTKYHTIESINF